MAGEVIDVAYVELQAKLDPAFTSKVDASIKNALKGAGTTASNALKPVGKAIESSIGGSIEAAARDAASSLDAITGDAASAADGIDRAFVGAEGTVGRSLADMASAASSSLDSIESAAKQAGDGVESAFSGVGDSISDDLEVGQVSSDFDQIADAGEDAAKDTQNAFFNAGKSIEKSTDDAANNAEKSFSRVSGTIKNIFKVTGVAIAGTLTGAIVGGFSRLDAIDQAKAKLDGLGNSADDVSLIMENALNSVRGTAFGLGDAATVAASAVASGVKPGQDLERTLKLIADTSTIAGASMDEVGLIFNKVAATGKVQGESLAQLGERGIPILQLLSDELGKTPAEVAKLASEGKVGFAEFQAALEGGLGGAALKSGNTFSGALANARAALGRFGAELIGPAFAAGPAVFGAITAKIDELAPVAAIVGDKLSGLGPIIADAFSNAGPIISGVVDAFTPLAGAIAGLAGPIGEILSVLGPIFADLVAQGGALGPIILPALTGIVTAFGWLLDIVANVVSFLDENREVAAALGAVMLVLAANTIATNAAWLVYGAVVGATRVATAAFTAVQWAMNAALNANPIGLAVIAFAALAAGLVYAYKNSEKFRAVIDKVGSVLKGAFTKAIDGVTKAFDFLRDNFDKIKAGLLLLLGPIGVIILAFQNWDKIKEIIGRVAGAILDFVTGLPAMLGNALLAIGQFILNATTYFLLLPVNISLALLDLVLSIPSAFTAAFEALWPVLTSAFDRLVNLFKNMPGNILNGLKVLGGLLRNLFTTALTKVRETVSNGFEKIVQFAINLPGRILRGLASLGKTLRDLFVKAWNAVGTAVRTGITNTLKLITDLPGKIKNAATAFLNAGKSLGKSVITGLGNGLKQTGGFLADIGNAIRGKINDVLGLPRTLGKGPLKFTIPAFARGGIVDTATLGVFGEAGREALLPLSPKYAADAAKIIEQSGILNRADIMGKVNPDAKMTAGRPLPAALASRSPVTRTYSQPPVPSMPSSGTVRTTTNNNVFEIHEVGDAQTTAARIASRLAIAAEGAGR